MTVDTQLLGYVTKPLTVGDIIGQSFRICRRQIALVFKVLLLPTVILGIGRVAVVLAGSYAFQSGKEATPQIAWAIVGIVGLICLIWGGLLLAIRQLALVRLFTGFAATIEEATEFVLKRGWSIINLILAWFAICLVAVISWAVVAVLAAPLLKNSGGSAVLASVGIAVSVLGFCITVIYLGLAGSLAFYGLAIEDGDLGAVLAKAFNLTFRSFLRTTGFGFLSMLSVAMLAYPLTLPIWILTVGYFLVTGVATGASETAQLPAFIQVLNALWETVTNMVIGPICYVAYGLFFCDLKMRLEGSDLLMRLASLQTKPAEDEPPPHAHALVS